MRKRVLCSFWSQSRNWCLQFTYRGQKQNASFTFIKQYKICVLNNKYAVMTSLESDLGKIKCGVPEINFLFFLCGEMN